MMMDDLVADKKYWSVKVSLLESEYYKLKDIADDLEMSLRKLVNKSIKFALNDINKGYLKRSDTVFMDKKEKLCSFKIKAKHYERLKNICLDKDLNIRYLIKDILSKYPYIVYEYEEDTDMEDIN
jgi:predicted DNA-binding ribbon-helix-helix protein